MFMLLCPGIEFKAVKRDALLADRDFCQMRPYGHIESVPIHAEVGGGIAQPQESWQAGLPRSRGRN
jgi:hypothetical protein